MPPKKKAFKHWTPDEVKILLDSVKSSKTAAAGIEKAAKKIGKRPETVRAKYYSMQKSKKKPRRTLKDSPTTRRSTVSNGMSTMSSSELSQLIQKATQELSRRATAVDQFKRLVG